MKSGILTNEQIWSFCTALEQLVHAGVSLGDGLVLMQEDEQDPSCRKMLSDMARQADAGASLSTLIRDSGRFPAYVSTLTEVGERVGRIEQTLTSLSRYYENRERMDRRMQAALLYPAMLILVLLAVAVVLLVWVLPVFNDVYAQLGTGLTGFAGSLLQLGQWLRHALPAVCLLAALISAILWIAPLRRQVVGQWNRILGDRGVRKAVYSARFVQALTMGLESGMTAPVAAELAVTLSQGEASAFEERCLRCVEKIREGTDLSAALYREGFLRSGERRLLDAGIRSGAGETVLQQIAQRQLEQSEEAMERQAGKLEPILVAVACTLIGGVILSVMLPLLDIMTAIG